MAHLSPFHTKQETLIFFPLLDHFPISSYRYRRRRRCRHRSWLIHRPTFSVASSSQPLLGKPSFLLTCVIGGGFPRPYVLPCVWNGILLFDFSDFLGGLAFLRWW
jgi:hypothetical protein